MKTFIFVLAACIGLAAPGLALAVKHEGGGEGGGDRIQKRFARMDQDDNGRVTLAEVTTAREKHFARMDANGDGVLTLEEFEGAKNGGPRRGSRRFKHLDANDDGKVTAAESAEATARWFERVDANGDGGITIGELQQWRPGGPGKKGDHKDQG